MALTSNHIVEEINGVRCTVIEKGVTFERTEFLRELLELNKLEVQIAEMPKIAEDPEPLFVIGVTDLVFNPVIAVYEMWLKTAEGKSVSPAYWEQKTTEIVDEYWTAE
jgi:hypothetical protein